MPFIAASCRMLAAPRCACICSYMLTTQRGLASSCIIDALSSSKQQQQPFMAWTETRRLHYITYSLPKHQNQTTWCKSRRWESTKPKQTGLVTSKESPYAGMTPAQKVKEAGKDTMYTGIIIVGVGVTGLMFYAIGKELLSKDSPSGVYGQALKLCKQNPEIIAALGEPIKGYGELSRRGRRRHVSHAEFEANGVKHMRMKFYIEGPDRKGTVQLEVRRDESGKYEYRYLFVELEGYPRRRIVLEDRR
ncbi:mitochondrial import inner membrane translocase subunit Tim21-like [Liolophura sinensis]|uniref:mitochondrial import inner membrane translocase subunit Tim21-like n=1 Tax=Liolophura sinensis TaxID=3198878 RepID=UPI003158C41B